MQVNDCCGGPKGEIIFAKITLSSNTNKDILVKFVDKVYAGHYNYIIV